jgi:peptidoglycan hydrolase-like protein with peptidoglycan-binding domain
LNAGEEASAINFTNLHYDSRSVRIIQIITGANVDGSFGGATAETVAGFQDANPPLAVDGKVGENTLNVMVPNRVAAGSQEHAIQIVADFYNLDTTRDTLTVHFDPGLAGLFNTTFQSGNLRVIQIGASAFTSATDLRDAIRGALSVAAPAGPAPGARPTHLTPAQEQQAAAFNRARYTDRRSVLGIQGLVGTGFDALFGPDTAERIAEFQDSHGLALVDGKVGEQTLRLMVAELDRTGQQDAAIRMIIDFFNLSEHGALLDIAFDPAETDNASTSGDIPGPSIVRVGPPAFAQGFEGLVHTIAHELEHVRQRREGIPSQAVREFLGEAIEIMSAGMPEEGAAGFMDDARRALRFWNRIDPADQITNAARFEEVRDQVNARFNNFTPAEQAAHQATVDAYNAVVVPVPVP